MPRLGVAAAAAIAVAHLLGVGGLALCLVASLACLLCIGDGVGAAPLPQRDLRDEEGEGGPRVGRAPKARHDGCDQGLVAVRAGVGQR